VHAHLPVHALVHSKVWAHMRAKMGRRVALHRQIYCAV